MFYRVGIFLDTWEFKILKAVVKSYKYTYDNCTHHMSIFKASLLRKANFFSFFFFLQKRGCWPEGPGCYFYLTLTHTDHPNLAEPVRNRTPAGTALRGGVKVHKL